MPSALVPWPQTSFFPGVSATVLPPVDSIRLPPKSQAAFISKPEGETNPPATGRLGLTCEPHISPVTMARQAPVACFGGKSAKMSRKTTLGSYPPASTLWATGSLV